MNNSNQAVKPIRTSPKHYHQIKDEIKHFLGLWEDSGKGLRSEFVANNNGCRIVIVFDWEHYEQSITK